MTLKAIVADIRDFLWDLCPYICCAFACINAALAGIGFFSYEGHSFIVFAGYFCAFMLAIACALLCLVKTVTHEFTYCLSRWISRTTFYLRNRNE